MTDHDDARAPADAELLASLRRLAANMSELVGISCVAIVLLDPSSGDLRTCLVWNAASPDEQTGDHSRGRPAIPPEHAIEGRVASMLEPVVVEDARAGMPGGMQTVAPDPRPGSLVCLPLIEADRLLGTLTATAREPRTFDAHRMRLLHVFAGQAALTIGKTVQAVTAQAQARELAGLLEASRALTSSLEPGQVFAQVVASLRAVLGCDDALIYACEPGGGMLHLVAAMGPRSQRLGAARIPLSDRHSLAARAAVEGRPHLIGSDAGEMGEVTEVFVSGDRLSLLAAPLISKHTLRGVVVLARPRPFRPTALAEMATLGNLIAAVLENVSLYQAARAGREQLAAIFDSASDAIALVDDGLRIVDANDAFAALTGLPAGELRGQRCPDVLYRAATPGNPLCEEHGVLVRAMASGEAAVHVESLFTRAVPGDRLDGQPGSQPGSQPGEGGGTGGPLPPRAYDFSVTPVPGPHGPRALLVGRDITAQREVEQLRASFLSMVSHELRGPLQTVNGYLDLVLGGQAGALGDQQRQYVHRARAGGQRLTTIVDDLLLLSRRDAGQFSLRREPLDVIPLAGEVAEEMELLAEEAGVRLDMELPAHLPLTLADGPRIAQVLRNLLSNAIKFTPRGGTVTLEAAAGSDRVRLRVRDTGVGIPAEHLQHIFERYYQVPVGARHDQPDPIDHATGQGLGLAIVRIIVEGHGGTVDVQSAPGRGSSFTFTLPLASHAAPLS